MKKGNYLKLLALNINGIEANIVDDQNVKDIDDACNYFKSNYQKYQTSAFWLILPCNYIVDE